MASTARDLAKADALIQVALDDNFTNKGCEFNESPSKLAQDCPACSEEVTTHCLKLHLAAALAAQRTEIIASTTKSRQITHVLNALHTHPETLIARATLPDGTITRPIMRLADTGDRTGKWAHYVTKSGIGKWEPAQRLLLGLHTLTDADGMPVAWDVLSIEAFNAEVAAK